MRLSVDVVGEEKLAKALRAMQVRENPRINRRAFGRSAKLFREHSRLSYLSGPAPRRLERATGETARRMEIDETRLPDEIVIGIPADLPYAEAYELGRWFGNRWKGGRRPFIQPTIKDLVDDFAVIYVEEWEDVLR